MKHQNRVSPGWWLFFLVVLLLVSPSTRPVLHAQTYPFREYTSDDGLPQTQSLGVMQDSRGYLWIPTRNGLARFDGRTFISYFRKDGLPSNIVSGVVEDKAGTIWAVTMNGMARFNGKRFINYPLPDSLGIKQMGLGCIGRDSASFFLNALLNYDETAIIQFEKGRYYNFTERHSVLKDRDLVPAAADPADSVIYLLGSRMEVYAFSRGKMHQVHPGPVTRVRIINGEPVYFNDLPAAGQVPGPFFWEGGPLSLNFVDREGTRWVGTETSIYRLMSDAFIEYDKGNGLPEGTWALAADPDGGLWAGTVSGNLEYFDGNRFTPRDEYLRFKNDHPAFYRGSATLSTGEIWFSTGSGVVVWDGREFSKLKLLPDGLQICIIYEDPVDKTVFVGTEKGLYHIEGRKVTLYEQMSWPGYGIVEGITRDHNGNYWLAGHYGVVFFNGIDFVPYRSAPAPAEMVWGVVCDHMGNIWSAGSDGLFICDPENPSFIEALPDEINLPANVIRNLDDNRLIVGRMMDICIIDLERYYSGLPDYYTIIGRSRGFTGHDCQDNGILKDAGGNWWILTSSKLIRFNPDRIIRNNYPPINHLTLVEIPGDTAEWVTIADTSLFYENQNKIKIVGRKNGVRISYTGISTRDPEDITFEYRMRGFNDTWSNRTADRSAVFTDLPPGDYTFEMHAFNADGVRSYVADRVELTVVPTFLQSLFARTVISLLALLIAIFLSLQVRRGVLIYRVRTARQQAESYRLQLNSVIRQFDPHFTFNAVTSVGSLIMKGEKEKAYNYFIKLSNLLRSIITDSGVLFKPLEQELEFVTRYCELQKLRFGSRFEYSISLPEGVNLKTPVPKMIIQSFAENAIKHGLENKKGNGKLEIEITSLARGMEVIVRDNGIGRSAASAMNTIGSGTGLKNIASIVQMMNRANREKITFALTDLYERDKPAGTEVRVFLPHDYSLDFPAEKPTEPN